MLSRCRCKFRHDPAPIAGTFFVDRAHDFIHFGAGAALRLEHAGVAVELALAIAGGGIGVRPLAVDMAGSVGSAAIICLLDGSRATSSGIARVAEQAHALDLEPRLVAKSGALGANELRDISLIAEIIRGNLWKMVARLSGWSVS